VLKNIPNLLGPELLYVLRSMGHGDDIAIVDANFPADSLATRLIRMDGHSATVVLEAILKLLPVDDFLDDPIRSMAVVGNPDSKPEIVAEFEQLVAAAEGRSVAARALSREEFYAAAEHAYAIVATGESRLYGNLLVAKGVVKPD
jgi:L-fucose mutarotase